MRAQHDRYRIKIKQSNRIRKIDKHNMLNNQIGFTRIDRHNMKFKQIFRLTINYVMYMLK